MKRPTTYRETIDYLAAIHRMIRQAGRRVADGDPDELLELIAIKHDVDQSIAVSIAGLRGSGATWDDIASATGTTRQAAHQKWGPNGTGGARA